MRWLSRRKGNSHDILASNREAAWIIVPETVYGQAETLASSRDPSSFHCSGGSITRGRSERQLMKVEYGSCEERVN